MSNVSQRQRKFLECTSRVRIHGHGRRLGAENQDPNFGPGYRSLYIRIEEKRPIFKFSPRGLWSGWSGNRSRDRSEYRVHTALCFGAFHTELG